MLVRWLVFIHILSAITFFLAHGASAAMAFKVRGETDFARIRAMLDLSQSMFKMYMLSFTLMGLTGLAMPFLIHIWDKVWIWLSIVLMVFVAGWMFAINEQGYKRLRKLVGLPYMQGNRDMPAEPEASPEEVQTLLRTLKPAQPMAVGYGIPAVVLWLMVFKPF